jgi:hypothetical protein
MTCNPGEVPEFGDGSRPLPLPRPTPQITSWWAVPFAGAPGLQQHWRAWASSEAFLSRLPAALAKANSPCALPEPWWHLAELRTYDQHRGGVGTPPRPNSWQSWAASSGVGDTSDGVGPSGTLNGPGGPAGVTCTRLVLAERTSKMHPLSPPGASLAAWECRRCPRGGFP